MLGQTIKWGEPLNISTKDGNAIVLSEEDYNGLIETANINTNPVLKTKIVNGLNTPLSECVSEDEVQW